MNSHEPPKCPQCGGVLPVDAPHGLCPRCLGAMNLGGDTLSDAEAATALPPQSPAELAQHFPQLDILECLGRGGMGVVYKARQKTLDRIVALKLLAPERVHDTAFADRFAQEAQALARLSHPNIVTIHDFGQAGGFYYLLMEFVDGVNLRQAMKAERLTPEQALAIVPPVCEALQYAHDHGIVHRDIKPENLLLDKEGRVKIADFGIAKMLGEEFPRAGTAETQVAGTPQYMAPEQMGRQPTDHRADIYSLGVVLYEMLTGKLPDDRIQPPSSRVRGLQIDVRLDEVVLRALERTPELRYQTATEMRTGIETITRTSAPQAAHPPAKSSLRQHTLLLVVAGLLVVGSLTITALTIWNSPAYRSFRQFGESPDLGTVDDAPTSETKVGDGHSTEVIHQKELSCVLFYAGTFLRSTSDAGRPFPRKAEDWNIEGTVTLENDRVVPYLLASVDALHLLLNEKKYDLREGRVFVLRDDGPVEQRKIEVSLATALDPGALAKQLAGENAGTSSGK